jgi:formylmethanofuran dehydrogenase subunit E
MATSYVLPDWAVAFHTHRCPYLALGFRMGCLAMGELRFERARNRGLLVLPEFGEGSPYTCIVDGIRAATGAIYGQIMIAKTFYGKLAATFYYPQRGGAVRYSLRTEFVDQLEQTRFHAFRARGVDPNDMPPKVIEEVMAWLAAQSDEAIFAVAHEVGFPYQPMQVTYARTRCARCGEYVLDTFVRTINGQPMCIPCSCEADVSGVDVRR